MFNCLITSFAKPDLPDQVTPIVINNFGIKFDSL